MVGGFNPEVFKAQLKEELLAENRLMIRKMMGEIIKLIKENQPTQLTGPVNLDIELPERNKGGGHCFTIIHVLSMLCVNSMCVYFFL